MRARSLLLSAAGVIAAVLVWLGLVALMPGRFAAADPAGRMAIGAAALLPGGVMLGAMTVAQIVLRFVSGTLDPTLGRDNRWLVLNQRVISNTVEQLLCFVPSLLALSAAVPPGRMPMIVALGLIFAIARLAFWIGYLLSPLLRAPGMAATGAANLTALAGALWVWLG